MNNTSTTEDPDNFIGELQMVFDVMHNADIKRVELASYKMKGISRILFDQ